MVKPTDQGASPAPADQGTMAAAEQLAAQIVSRAGGEVAQDPAGAQPPPGGDEGAPLTGDVLVQWGGATRTMKVEDLVKRAMQSEQAAEISRLADEKLAANAAFQQLGERLAALSPAQQQRFAAIMQNPSLLDAAQQDSSDDGDLEPLLNGNGSQHAPRADDGRLARIESAVEMLMRYVGGEVEQKQQQTLGSRVDEALDQFSVFKLRTELGAGARARARETLLLKLAANKGASVEDLAAQAAADWTPIVHRAASSAPRVAQQAAPSEAGLGPSPFSGDDLLNGNASAKALAAYQRIIDQAG